jgi:hypothetical protein
MIIKALRVLDKAHIISVSYRCNDCADSTLFSYLNCGSYSSRERVLSSLDSLGAEEINSDSCVVLQKLPLSRTVPYGCYGKSF